MQFEWDPDKAAKNLKLHKVDFEVAQRVFEDPFHIDDIDDREDYGEERSNIIGMVDNRLLVVTYTLRGGATRLISARKAKRSESRRYHEEKNR
jgi:uncharacterized protein